MNTNEYLFCTRCGSEEFSPKPDAVLEQEFKGETFNVTSPAMACTKCGELALTDSQLEELRRHTADAYRKNHNLLTSAQIRAMREALGKTQREFAAFLRVGEASVKRWETWLVQEASSDELIRVKCVMAKKAASMKRNVELLRQHAASEHPSADWQRTTKEAQSLLAGLRRYLGVGQREESESPPLTLTEPVKLGLAQVSALWRLRSCHAAQPAAYPWTSLHNIQFQVLACHAQTPETPAGQPCQLPQYTRQASPRQFSGLNTRTTRRDQCNDPSLTPAA